jgi:hypothetical protein
MTQPLAIRVTRYQCPHCSRTSSKKAAAQAHIGRCWHNPDNRGCKTCTHYEPAGSGAQCVPGDQCTCNTYPESCAAEAAPDDSIPLTRCPLWQPIPWGRPR